MSALPPLILPGDFDTLSEWLEVVHGQYTAMVGEAGIIIMGKPLVRHGAVCADGRDETFWHLITDGGHLDGVRRLSLTRAAYLGRAWHLLELLAAGDVGAVWWRERSVRGTSVHVAPANFAMHVVLGEGRACYHLKTAFPTRPADGERYLERAVRAWASGECSKARALRSRSPRPSKEWPAWERARRWMG